MALMMLYKYKLHLYLCSKVSSAASLSVFNLHSCILVWWLCVVVNANLLHAMPGYTLDGYNCMVGKHFNFSHRTSV